MARLKVSAALRAEVRESAKSLCEYCHTDETWQYVPFTIDHVIPVSTGGSTKLENLALACFYCNRYKGDATQAADPTTDQILPLFNPRTQRWDEHFIWSSDKLRIVALTATARATLQALNLNRERVQRIREADVAVGRHPPQNDPVQSEEE